jgi:SAM-dependent methyltransferase
MWFFAVLSALGTLAIVSILWPGLRGAPWVPTRLRTVRKMLDLAEVGPGDRVYDLGCGDGRTIVTAARRYGARAVGIEIDPLRYVWCQTLITVLGLRDRVRVVYGDFFAQDLSQADVVTCYLLDSTNLKLQKKLLSELAPNARVVSHMFAFPELHLVHYEKQDQLYLYKPKR